LDYGIATLSIIPGRSSPSHSAEMSQQLLFGELYRIEERHGEWTKVRTEHDSYPCWIQDKQTFPIEKGTRDELLRKGRRAVSPSFQAWDDDGNTLHLVAGSFLYEEASSPFPAWPKEPINFAPLEGKGERIVATAASFLRTPYLWGGRTAFGADCSGFVQLVLLLHGIFIQRDASDQVREGSSLPSLDDAKAGDLAFFHNEKGKVVHVGLLDGKGRIVHASGMVRIDPIDGKGILPEGGKEYSHHLHSLRRMS
jgi:hypothetical protein